MFSVPSVDTLCHLYIAGAFWAFVSAGPWDVGQLGVAVFALYHTRLTCNLELSAAMRWREARGHALELLAGLLALAPNGRDDDPEGTKKEAPRKAAASAGRADAASNVDQYPGDGPD